MKNTVLWLMMFLLLLSCVSCRDDGQDNPPVTTASVVSQTEEQPPSETEPVENHVRCRRQYTVTELTDRLPDTLSRGMAALSKMNMIFYDGMMYAFSCHNNTVGLYTLSVDGTVSEQISIPVSSDMYVMFAAPCRDGFYLIGGRVDGRYHICIVDQSGTVFFRDSTEDLCNYTNPDFFIHETEDGQTAILVNYYHHVTCRYLFDGETLVRETVIDTSSNAVQSTYMQYIGNGVYTSLSRAENGTKLDFGKKTAQPYALRIPSNRGMDNVLFDTSGEIYLDDGSDGIHRYRDDAMASTVLNWIDVDIPQGSGLGGQNTVWVMDGTSFYVAHPDTVNGDTGIRLFHIKSALVPDIDERTVIEIRSYEFRDEWLQRAIRSFNDTNKTYRAEVTFRTSYNIYEQNEDLQQTLLYEARPDLCITSANTDLDIFYDKGAFCDLLPIYGNSLLGCVKDARQYMGALYTIPMRMRIETFACPQDVCDGLLTWTAFRETASSLASDAMLYTASLTSKTAQHIFNNALLDYVSFKNAFSFYNSDEFREMLIFSQTMETMVQDYYGYMLKDDIRTAGRYGITVPVMNTLFSDGRLKYLTVQLDTIEAVMVTSLLLGEDFNWCGYPSEDGGGAYVYPDLNCSVFADTDVYDGCIAFLHHLLSVELQADDSLTERYLSVTVDGIREVLSSHRYWYYEQRVYDAIGDPNAPMTEGGSLLGGTTTYLPVSAAGYSTEYLDNFGPQKKTEGHYVVLELTEEMQERFLDFLQKCRMKANTDRTISSIVEEELSYWEGGVRTLEETTNIIDRRVWIYLNE